QMVPKSAGTALFGTNIKQGRSLPTPPRGPKLIGGEVLRRTGEGFRALHGSFDHERHKMPDKALCRCVGQPRKGVVHCSLRPASDAGGELTRVGDAAVAEHELVQPKGLLGPPCCGAAGEIGAYPATIRFVRGGEQVDQHQGALALDEVSQSLLPVIGRVSHEIENVVADLKGGPEMEAERD